MASRQHFKCQQVYITVFAQGKALNAHEMVGHLSLVLGFNQNPESLKHCALSKGGQARSTLARNSCRYESTAKHPTMGRDGVCINGPCLVR